MESTSHPVPQNVTDFQFHLVGDMTLKQFGYLAVGCGAAYLTFVIFSSVVPFIAYPLIFLFAGSGIALAFVPIQERPLDQWLGSFIRAIFSSTLLKYKPNALTVEDPRFGDRLNIYLGQHNMAAVAPNPVVKTTPPIQPERPIFQALSSETSSSPASGSNQPYAPAPQPIRQESMTAGPSPQPENQEAQAITPQQIPSDQVIQNTIAGAVSQPPSFNPTNANPDLPSSEEINNTVELAKQAQSIQAKIVESEHELNQIKTNAATPGADPQVFAQKFQGLINDLQKLNEEASGVSRQLANLTKTPEAKAPKVIVVPTQLKIAPSLTLTSTPNIINGVVKDAMGNYVEQAIIVAHDRQALPVRALKTNKLGQFVAATPLPSGTYTMTVEKDDLVFDTIQIDLVGELMRPILMQARKADRPAI